MLEHIPGVGRPLSHIRNNPKGFLSGVELTLFSRYPIGTNIFELEWDIALVLDTCRIDVLREIQDEYGFLDEINSIISVGAATPEWICNTFSQKYLEEIQRTAYVAGNGFAEAILDRKVTPEGHEGAAFARTNWDLVSSQDLSLVDFVWRAGDDDLPTGSWEQYYSTADTVTDHAIAHWRDQTFDRMIVHYIEPHHPYLHTSLAKGKETLGEVEAQPFGYLKNGGDRKKVWEMYKTELRAGLDAVETLLNNSEAERVLITADHGEAFGEWTGQHHRSGSLHPHVRRVPVVWTSGSDTKTHTPDITIDHDDERSIEQHLTALGYK